MIFQKLLLNLILKILYIVPSGVVPPNPSELLGSKS